MTRMQRISPAIFLLLSFSLAPAKASHLHTAPNGRETAPCTCRPATEVERADPSVSPDGWMQDDPREAFNRGDVPLPLVPDWVGTRVRAAGGLCWGDIDGDQDQDLVVGTYWANQYPPLVDYYNFAYINNGGVLEADPSWISSDQKHTTDVKAGRINADGYLDFFFGNGGESLQPSQVFYGTSGMLPTTAGWNSSDNCWTVGCSLADFDRDGDLDCATANQGNSGNPYRPTYLFRNTGAGLETAPSWQSQQVGITNSADWGDMDGDGWLDLAVAGWVNWQSGVFSNTHGSLETTFAWTTGHPERTDKGIGWADVDGDLDADLAVGGNGAPGWLFENEGGMLGAEPIWASADSYHGTQELAWVDIDGDGDSDLATVHFSTGHARVHLNNDGVLSAVADWQYDAASSGTAIAFGDLNGDGCPDLAMGVANGPIMVFVNTGVPAGVYENLSDLPARGQVRMMTTPNPARGVVRMRIDAGAGCVVDRIAIFDTNGRQVGRIDPEDASAMHTHSLSWDPGDLPPGVYFARAIGIDADRPFVVHRRLVLMPR